MPAATSIALGVGAAAVAGGTAGKVVSGMKAASAQERAAQMQLAERRKERELALQLAEPTTTELLSMDKAIQFAEAANARNARVLDSVDPALIEAGEQALELMQGKEATVLEPIRGERQRQRQELRARLADQLGPGFETSSAGIRALNEFDNQTSMVLNNAQMNMLGSLLHTSAQTRQVVSPFQGASTFATLADVAGGVSRRRVAAATGTPVAPYAGGSELAKASRYQAIGGAFGGLTQLGGLIGGAAAGGMFSGGGAPVSNLGSLGRTDLVGQTGGSGGMLA